MVLGALVASVSSVVYQYEGTRYLDTLFLTQDTSLPASLRALVSRCLEKRPDQRFSTASEIRTELAALQSAGHPTAPVSRRSWLWIAAAGLAATASGVAWWESGTTRVKMLSTGGPPSASPEANDLFELATSLAAVQNNIPQALETFNRALSIDPHFSEARRSHAS